MCITPSHFLIRATLFLLLGCVNTISFADINLKFGVYTADKPTSVVNQFRPILNDIEKALSIEMRQPVTINMAVAKDYETGVSDLIEGKVDFARFGPASYTFAHDQNSDIEILAVEKVEDKTIFYGVICVHSQSNIEKVSDLDGKTFAFGDPQSTIGRYLAQKYLSEHQIYSNRLSHYDYLERHDRVGNAVAIGKFDAGALKEGTFQKLVKQGKPLREIARFENVTKPWVARSGLSPIIIEKIKKVLLSQKDTQSLSNLGATGFTEADELAFEKIKEAIANNNLFFVNSTHQ